MDGCVCCTACRDTIARYGCRSPVIALALVLVSVMLLVSCGKSERACGSSRDALACVVRVTQVSCLPAVADDVHVRADSACSRADTGSTPPPICGCVLAVVGTGERALLRFNTHTHTHS